MGDGRKIRNSAFIFCLTGLLETLQIFLTELLKETKRETFLCLSYLSLSERLWFDSECFVFVFVLSLRTENSQHSMLSSEELENI